MKTDDLYKAYLSRVFKANYSGLYGYGYKLSGSSELTKDAIQELFVQLWGNRSRLDKIRNIESYLFRSLRNNLLKELKKAPLHSFDECHHEDFELSQEDLLINSETSAQRAKAFAECLNALAPRQKEVVFLRFYNGLKYSEIAEIMGISVKTVKNLAFSAMKKLRKGFSQSLG